MRASFKVIHRHFILLILLVSSHAYAAALPSFQQVRNQYHSSFATLLDRNGEAIQTLQLDTSAQRLPWVTLQELSPAMQEALLVSEDHRFFQHQGVDWRAMASAAWENLVHNTHRGASTLTMQLMGLLEPSLTRGTGGRTYLQKWQQIGAARKLEKHWSKAQILEAYLNLVDFKSNLYGINAATAALFNKSPATINPAEASILAALLRGPNAKPRIVAERACGVAALLHPPRPNCADITALSLQQLHAHPKVGFATAIAPEVAQQLLHTPAQRVITSLDAQLQKIVLSSLQKDASHAASAAVILDNSTAEILAYSNSDATKPNNIIVPHPASTILQPFIYELAIEQKRLTAATLLDNTPVPIAASTPFPDYMVDTPGHDWVSTRTALSTGLAAPALRAQALLSPTDYAERLRHLGLNPTSQYSTLLNIANAYQTLANNGQYQPASFHVAGLNKPQRIMPAKAAAIISSILANQDIKDGFYLNDVDNYYALASRPQYAVGYTANYTIAVWIENSATLNAADIWQRITADITRLHPSHPPKLPNNLMIQNVQFNPPVEPPRPELFLPGTEQSTFSPPSYQKPELFSQPIDSNMSLNYPNQ
ncbi:transglycosylase domain-containing protein [Sulfuriferula thiophila]|uniref:transglycosylase domain-containing protein n=1 Tax=Sulfuriferula thiophila TaxID=1781211 RepID=UPI000F60D65C|nr:transglycosylase domain-containing protein [Sulfuriferula thiophila]